MPKRANPVTELQYAYLGLHQAALSGNVGLVQYALSQGQPVDAVWDGISALHAAAAGGSEHVVKLLLDNGADVNFGRQTMSERELKTRTAFMSPLAADALPSSDILIHLLNPGSTPLHFACAHNHAAAARVLLARGAAPHIPDKRGITSLVLLPPATPSSSPPDAIRVVIREYYEKEKAKEKEFQKHNQSHLPFHGKAAAVLGFPKVEEDSNSGGGASATTGTTPTTTTSRSITAQRSLEGLLTLTASPGTKVRGKSPPPSPARYTFATSSSTATPTPPPLSHRRPSLPHVASSSHLPARPPSPYRTLTRTPSSARPPSADDDEAPLFGTTAHTSRSATLPVQPAHGHTLSGSLLPTYLPQSRPPRNKRSLLSLFSKKESEDKKERDKIRQASFGASMPPVLIPVTAPAGQTTFASAAASTEVFVDDEEEDYGKPVNHGVFANTDLNAVGIVEYDRDGASSGSEGDEESGSGSDEEGGAKGLGLELGAAIIKTPPMRTTVTPPTISTSPLPVPKLPSPHVSPLVTRTLPGILRSSGSVTTSPSSTRPNSNILRRSGSLRFQDDDTDERPSTRERELQPRKPNAFGSGRKSMDGYEGRSIGPPTRSPTMRRKSNLSLREKASTPAFRDRGRSGSGSTSPATVRRKSSGMPVVPPLPSLDYHDPPSTPSTEEDGLGGHQREGLDIHTVSSMAEAKALVDKAAQEILELDNDDQERTSAGGGLSLSEQLAAYGEKLAIERRFARGEKQRWKSEKEKEEEAAVAREEEGRERDREEERRKRVQEKMLWSQRTIERYAKREGERDKDKDPMCIGTTPLGCPLERTTSLDKEGQQGVKTSPSPPRSSRKVRRPHTSDSVNSSASSSIPRFGHSSTQSSGHIRVMASSGEHLQVFQRDAVSFDYGSRDREKEKDKYRGRRSEDILRTAFDANFERDRELAPPHVSAPPILPIAPQVVFSTSSGASSRSNVAMAEEGGGRPLKKFGGGLRSLFGKGKVQ